jgi:hypothetical protein
MRWLTTSATSCARWRRRKPIKDWSLSSLVISHGRSIVFQMAEVAIPRQMFQEILAAGTCLTGVWSNFDRNRAEPV